MAHNTASFTTVCRLPIFHDLFRTVMFQLSPLTSTVLAGVPFNINPLRLILPLFPARLQRAQAMQTNAIRTVRYG